MTAPNPICVSLPVTPASRLESFTERTRALLAEGQVVHIPATTAVTAAQQIAFTRGLGELGTLPDGTHHQDFHEGYFPYWHSDIAPQEFPHLYTMLACVVAAPESGQTPFMKLAEVEKRLPSTLIDEAIEVFSLSVESIVRLGFYLDPRDREPHLLFNLAGVRNIERGAVECSPAERELAIRFHRAVDACWSPKDPAISYEHRWRAGDILVWDNLRFCHMSPAFDGLDENRWLRRTTVRLPWEHLELLVPDRD